MRGLAALLLALGALRPAAGSGVEVLKGVRIRVPEAVRAGDTAKLACDYDLEDSPLYTIKWYRSDEEFYRYVPKESPATKVFPKPGINVDINLSNAREVTLWGLKRNQDSYMSSVASAMCWA
ncbi:uncharacterized protein LOC134530008 [Bacillus rossius redtenbacheri]|uniref:uncharacterized protein LOC134530008 n=1 Tax=Bacillus rossius redtenbacheri TaxID=93214 RepID=UPI002FDD2EC1